VYFFEAAHYQDEQCFETDTNVIHIYDSSGERISRLVFDLMFVSMTDVTGG
jgi:hypothetical protein